MGRKTLLIVLFAAAVLAVTICPALAVDDGHGAPRPKARVPWLALVYFVVGLAGVCVAAFKRSGRTHLD